jgi:Cellulase (glycosyl hydrolase family 5)
MARGSHRRARTPVAAFLAVACAALALALPTAVQAATPGVVVFGPNTDAASLQRIQASGARQVRVFLSWRQLETSPGVLSGLSQVDDFVNRMQAMGIGVYFVVLGTPAWATPSGADNAPPPPGPFTSFMGRLATHLRGRVIGYELWNEPDWPTFWQGSASPTTYAALLRAAYPATKQADPAAKVGVGGLVGNDYDFVQGLYANGAQGNFDFVGVHTDNDCIRTDPRIAVRDVDGRVSRWSFTGYREVRQVMLDHGDDKPIWMSELGWSVASGQCPSRPSDLAGVTPADQATFLTHAFACLAADPYVQIGTWFSLSDFGAADTIPFRFGLYDYNGAARPALAAFHHAGSVAPDPSCGLPVDRAGPGIALAYPTNGQNRSGDLVYRVTAGDPSGVTTLSLLVDGRLVRITGQSLLKGKWTGWRRLRLGPHTVTVRATDSARNVSTQQVTVNKVRYGDGEPVGTRIALGLYGNGLSRVAGGRLFTVPHEARPQARGRLTIYWERQSGHRWLPSGRAAAATPTRAVRAQRKFSPGRYRVVAVYSGYKAFRPAVARRAFTIG